MARICYLSLFVIDVRLWEHLGCISSYICINLDDLTIVPATAEEKALATHVTTPGGGRYILIKMFGKIIKSQIGIQVIIHIILNASTQEHFVSVAYAGLGIKRPRLV
jgi:hypothetical protein